MFKNNYKGLFCFLLIPFYGQLFIIIFFGVVSGLAIMWKESILWAILNFSSGWLLSHRQKISLNILGFMGFIYMGWTIISSIFREQIIRVVSWKVDLTIGSFIILLGVIGFVFVLVRRTKLLRNPNSN